MNKLEAIVAERTAARRHVAETAAAHVLETLRAQGIDIRVFGSLARGDFMAHSDVDFLVKGPIDLATRVAVESTVAREFRAADPNLPCDVIYLDDLTSEQAAAFERA